jgi:type VI secretion system secreted protein VgrG
MIIMAKTGLRFTLSVAGLPEDTFVVAGFTLQEQYSSLFQLELELASANPAVAFDKVLDGNVTLTVWRDEEVQRTVSGIAVSMEQGDTGRHQTRYSLSVRPALWRATLVRNSRIFQQQDLPAIVATLLKEHGIQDYEFSFRYARSQREFCVQYQEDDVAFIQRMTAEEGIFYFFEHRGNRHTLVFSDDCTALGCGPELPYHPQSDDQLGINTLRRRESLRPSDVLLKDYTFTNPDWRAEYEDYGRGTQHETRRYLHYDYPGRYKDGTGKQFSRWRMEALRNDAYQGEGASNCAVLEPGSDFTLTHHPHEAMNTSWQITGVSHTGRQPQALEGASGERGATLINQFTFIPREQTWRPLLLDKPRIDGAQIAIVTGPPGEEIYCDNHGRIRVRFLWDRSGRTDDTSSCWIRVSHPWAGQGWGNLAIPRIGHEVIIEFLNGDPDQPVVIGRTYHASNIPPGRLPGSKTQMSIRSKTHKGEGFNELRFDDANGNEEVFIHAQKNMNTKVLHDKHLHVKHNGKEVIDNNQEIHVGASKMETVKLTRNVAVGGANTLTVGGVHAVNVALSNIENVGVNKEVFVGDKLELISERLIEIRCGKSLIRMKKDGSIEIKGTRVVIDDFEPYRDDVYSRQFVLLDEESNTPIANQKYKVTMPDGVGLFGETNELGETEVYTTESPENIYFKLLDSEVM